MGSCPVRKIATIIQIVVVSFVVIYGTACLYMGYFEGAFATFPFLLFYYVYVVAKQQKQRRSREAEDDES